MAECIYKGRRLIVRRTRLAGSAQQQLWPDWRPFAFVTDLVGGAVEVDAFHRRHAVVELAIRDVKEGPDWSTFLRALFANSAWLLCAALAHDLVRWTAMLGELTPEDHLTVARTVRTRFIAMPARLVNRRVSSPSGSARLALARRLHPGPRAPACPALIRYNEHLVGGAPETIGLQAPTPGREAQSLSSHALVLTWR